MDQNKKQIQEKRWAYVGGFRGKVIRIREHQGETLVDIEIGGEINPYPIKDVEPE